MRPLFTNLAVGRLAAPITSTATSFTLQPGQGAAFPSPGTGQVAILTLQSGAAYEIVHCTSRADDVFNVIRAREGTAAQAWPSGTTVELRVTAGGLNSVVDMADDAVTTASAASATASTALTTANTANTTANTALTTANSALTAAGNAQSTADNALNVANAALPRSGAQPMLGRLDLVAGTNGGLAFVGDTDTGLVQSAADTIQLRTGGDVRLTVANAGIQVHAPITVPAATAPGHAVRLDQLPASFVRQFVTATYATNAITTSNVFVSTGATISITPTLIPCRLLVYALIPAPYWVKSFAGGGGGGGESAEFRFTSSLGNGVPSRISGTFYVPSQTITVGNYQAITVRDFRAVSSSGTYIFTLQMRVTGSDEQVSTRANEAAIMLEAWELAP